MRVILRATFALLWTIAAISLVPAVAQAAPALEAQPSAELALAYSYVRANAPPAGCGCFSMNGGSASFAYRLAHSVSVVGEFGAVNNGNVDSTGLDLTLSTYLAGPRYSLHKSARFTPFAQVLVGGAHASGGLAPSEIHTGSSTAFAMAAGGGLDIKLTRHLAFRAFQTDYLLTLLPNRVNDHQNNFRLSTGVVLRFGR
jgi:peptidoglycan-associated lipoprotein